MKKNNREKRIKIIVSVVVAVFIVFFCIVTFTGDIEVKYQEDSLTLEADYWKDLTIEYAAMENLEYCDNDNVGSKTNGFDNTRILAGAFRNYEFGNYTRYSYTKCEACVVLEVEEKRLWSADRM